MGEGESDEDEGESGSEERDLIIPVGRKRQRTNVNYVALNEAMFGAADRARHRDLSPDDRWGPRGSAERPTRGRGRERGRGGRGRGRVSAFDEESDHDYTPDLDSDEY